MDHNNPDSGAGGWASEQRLNCRSPLVPRRSDHGLMTPPIVMHASSSSSPGRLRGGSPSPSPTKRRSFREVSESPTPKINVFESTAEQYISQLKAIPQSKMWNIINRNVDQLHWCRAVISIVANSNANVNPHLVSKKILESARVLVNADRATIFTICKSRKDDQGYLKATNSVDIENLRLPLDRSSIAGEVAQTGQWELIKDVYKDTRFNAKIDHKTGYRTHSMICGPIKDAEGNIIAVIQLINKLPLTHSSRGFTREDFHLVQCVSSAAGIALKNAQLFSSVKQNSERAENMLRLLQALTTHLNVDQAIENIMLCASAVLKAERVSLYLVDRDANELVCKVSEDVKGIRIPMTRGIAGHVATTGVVENVANVYQDSRFNPQIDIDTGFRTRCILCGPIQDREGRTIAVVQAINKHCEEGSEDDSAVAATFEAEDELLLRGICAQAGIALTNAKLFNIEKDAHIRSAKLIDISKDLNGELQLSKLRARICFHAKAFCAAEKSTVFIVDADAGDLIGTDDFRFPLSVGTIAGRVASTGKSLNITNPHASELFNPETDARSNRQTRGIFAVPLKSGDGCVLGVLECVNKMPVGSSFDAADIASAEAFAQIAAGAVRNAQLHSALMRYGAYVKSILGSLSTSVFTLNEKGFLELCSSDLADVLGAQLDENSMRKVNYDEWPGLGETLSADISKVYATAEPVLVTDYELPQSKIRINYSALPLNLGATGFNIELPSNLLSGSRERSRRGSLFESSEKRENGVVVVIERVSIRDAMQYQVARYKNRLSVVEAELETLKSDINTVSETPVQQVVRILGEATAASTGNTATDEKLREALRLLRSPDLFKPSFMSNMGGRRKRRGSVLRGMIESSVPDNKNLRSWLQMAFGTNQVNLDVKSLSYSAGKDSSSEASSSRPGSRDAVHTPLSTPPDTPNTKGASRCLQPSSHDFAVKDWDFNTLSYMPDELLPYTVDIFSDAGVLAPFNIDNNVFVKFLRAIKEGYRPNAFHNFQHGVAVAHIVYMLLQSNELRNIFGPLERLGLLTAALCHDLDHRGYNNAFEVNAGTPLAIMYNDQSVLENHHASLAYHILNKTETGIFLHLPAPDQKLLRKLIVKSILSTDMAVHFELMTHFDNWVANMNEDSDVDIGIDDKVLVANTLLHCADLSNPVRKYRVAKSWAHRLNIEFKAQVEKEREVALPVSSMMESSTDADVAMREVKFLDFVILPCWTHLASFLPQVDAQIVQARLNRSRWLNRHKRLSGEEDAK